MKIRWHEGYWVVLDAQGRELYQSLSAQMAFEWRARAELKVAA